MLEQTLPGKTGNIPAPLLIKEMKIHTPIHGWLYVSNLQQRTATTGKSYLQFTLRDQTCAEIVGRQFTAPTRPEEIPAPGHVVLLTGTVDNFQNRLYLKLSSAKTDPSAPHELFTNTTGTRQPLSELEQDFWRLLHEVKQPDLAQLLDLCFNPATIERFRRWPASVRNHSAVVGGLLEHTVKVTTLAEQLTHHYPSQRELVIAGALLHDIGKLEELEEKINTGFTDAGKLVGHIVLGMQYVQQQAHQVPALEETLLRDLLHIILSHHGTQEHGSPICPATIEALIVHEADSTEARLTSFLEHCQRVPTGQNWTAYNAAFGGPLRIPE